MVVPVMTMKSSRIRWQCRRGMRELDELLMGYLESAYATASEPEKAAFRKLLALPDPALKEYLVNGEVSEVDADESSRRVINRIRDGARTAAPGT